jgi:hypothetical protein
VISLIVPAHNEAGVIERTLRTMLHHARPGEVEAVVVCNGCTDTTAEVARGVPGPIRVIETPIASKSHALNLGDSAAQGFPRFYVDADVMLSIDSIRQVAAVLTVGRPTGHACPFDHPACATCVVPKRKPAALAAAPRMDVDLHGRPWRVRAFYQIWTHLPYCSQCMIGSGVYALSREGRSRFGAFPDIISDDGYIRLLFKPGERVTVGCSEFEIQAPHTLWSLIKIKTRSQYGKYQLHAAHPDLLPNDGRSYGNPLKKLLGQPRLWPSLFVYCFVLSVARGRSLMRYLAGRRRAWDRDDTTRESAPAAGPEIDRDTFAPPAEKPARRGLAAGKPVV